MKSIKGKKSGSTAEKAGLTLGPGEAGSQLCAACSQVLPLGQYHWKDAIRQDNTCKGCRRLQRIKRDMEPAVGAIVSNANESVAQSPEEPLVPKKVRHNLLDAASLAQLAEAFLILETWQAEADTQGEISNSKVIQTLTDK